MKFPLFPFLLSANALPSTTTTSSIVRITKEKFGKKQNSYGQTNQLKLPTASPSKKIPGGEQSDAIPDTAANIEGVYVYTNKCSMVYQAVIGCGLQQDEDFCLYTEFKLGILVDEEYPGSIPVPGNKDQSFLPNSELPSASDPGSVDPEKVCVFSGTFSKSARMEGNALKPVPLASSHGCGTGFTNYQLVMRARITNSDGDLDLGFSSDYGETYYTDEKDCPVSYIGSKQSFQDSAFPDGPLRHRALYGWQDFATTASKMYVTVKDVVDIYVAVVHCFVNYECEGYHPCWSAAYEDTYLKDLAECANTMTFATREDAENACINCGRACGGIVVDAKGDRWETRTGHEPKISPTNETSYVKNYCRDGTSSAPSVLLSTSPSSTPTSSSAPSGSYQYLNKTYYTPPPTSSPSSPPAYPARCYSAAYRNRYISGYACGDETIYETMADAEIACNECGSGCNSLVSWNKRGFRWDWSIRNGSILQFSDHGEATYMQAPCSSGYPICVSTPHHNGDPWEPMPCLPVCRCVFYSLYDVH